MMMTHVPVTKVANKDQAQALANFLWCEKERHLDDICKIEQDLFKLEQDWAVEPVQERVFVEP